jgi:hypothetical protein
VKNPVILLSALALASCVPPKAAVIPEVPKKTVIKAPVAPEKPALADDGLRLPDMLTLPDDTIIARPPTE